MQKVKKVALAYSGGLDTSIIIPWLIENYRCEVIAVTANVGQEDELDGLEEKALQSGASKFILQDLREEFVADYIFPMLKSGRRLRGQIPAGFRAGPAAHRHAPGEGRGGRRAPTPCRTAARARATTRSASS